MIFFIGFNIYYALYIQKQQLHQQINNIENFAIKFLDEYKSEAKQFQDFTECNKQKNPACTSSIAEFQKYNADLTKPVVDPSNKFYSQYSNYETNFTYKNIKDMNYGYRYYNDVMMHKALLAYRCLDKSPAALKQILDNNKDKNGQIDAFPYIHKKIYIHNETMLIDFIATQIKLIVNNSPCTKYHTAFVSSADKPEYCDTNLKLNKQTRPESEHIFGPIYVCMSQSPYLRTGENAKTMVNARFDVVNNERAYYVQDSGLVTKTETDGPEGPFSSLYAEILIIFPLYHLSNIRDGQGKITHENMKQLSITTDVNRLDNFLKYINTFFVKSNLCALKCNKSEYYCGCLNANEDDMKFDESINVHERPFIHSSLAKSGIQKYKSVCLNVVNNKNMEANYSMLYYLNPYHANFTDVVSNLIR